MNLTIAGFAPPRTVRLRGKGGNPLRRDNGVPPPAPAHAAHKTPAPAALEWQEARLPVVGRVWARVGPPLLLVAACLVLLMYLLETSGIAATGYDIQRLQVERDDWQLRNEQLQFELGKRRSLTWIEAYATEQLGMVRPEPTALTYVRYSR